MFCFRYRKMLMPYSEGALPQGSVERLERHLHSCARCSDELASITVTAQALRRTEIPAMEPAADLWARVRGEIQREPSPHPVWQARSFQAASAAVAATVLILFVATRSPFTPMEQLSEQAPVRSEGKIAGKADQNSAAVRPSDTDGSMKPARVRQSVVGRRVPPPSESKPAPAKNKADAAKVAVNGPSLLFPSYRAYVPMPRADKTKELESADSFAPGSGGVGGGLGYAAKPSSPLPSASADVRAIDIDNSLIVRDEVSTKTAAAPKPPSQSAESVQLYGSFNQFSAPLVPFSPSPVPAVSCYHANEAAPPEKDRLKFSFDASSSPQLGATTRTADAKLKRDTVSLRDQYNAKLAKSPNDVDTMSRLADVEEQLGDKAAAIKWRKRLTELRPAESVRWADLGRVYEANSQWAEATTAYRKAISLGLKGNREAEVHDRLKKLEKPVIAPANSSR